MLVRTVSGRHNGSMNERSEEENKPEWGRRVAERRRGGRSRLVISVCTCLLMTSILAPPWTDARLWNSSALVWM